MAQIVEFPKQKQLSSKEVSEISQLIEQALYSHSKLEQIADNIKNDKELSAIPSDVLLKTLGIMLDN